MLPMQKMRGQVGTPGTASIHAAFHVPNRPGRTGDEWGRAKRKKLHFHFVPSVPTLSSAGGDTETQHWRGVPGVPTCPRENRMNTND